MNDERAQHVAGSDRRMRHIVQFRNGGGRIFSSSRNRQRDVLSDRQRNRQRLAACHRRLDHFLSFFEGGEILELK